MDILDQLSRDAYKAGEFIVKKAVLAKDFTVATWNAAELRAEIEEHYKAIGKLVFRAHATEADTSAEIQAHVEAVELALNRLRETEEGRQALCHRKLCPACEKPVSEKNSYCPHCGAAVK